MLDNRKPGELPELNNKMVKVRQPEDTETQSLILVLTSNPLHPQVCICVFFRAQSGWCSMTAGCSIQSTSSWRAGSGIVPGTVSLTSVIGHGASLPSLLFYEKTNPIVTKMQGCIPFNVLFRLVYKLSVFVINN